MKNKYCISILIALVCLCGLTNCKKNTSNLNLSGDCLVEQIGFESSYNGQIDLPSRTITVVLPESLSRDDLQLTKLQISAGATANYKEGDHLCLREPRTLRVTNGNVLIDWTIIAKNEEALIKSFKINDAYTGIINSKNNTISVYVPESVNITALVPTVTLSEGATISPAVGVATDFTNPVTYKVDNNSAHNTYVVTVYQIDKPEALYVGLAETFDQLGPEEYTACQWMLANIGNSLYVSWDDLKSGAVDISECKVMWWHFHRDGGVDGKDAWELYGAKAMENLPLIQDYVSKGGNLFLTRYACYLPAYLTLNGFVPNPTNPRVPNNGWGGKEDEAETTQDAWSFFTDSTSHPLYQGLQNDGNPNKIYTCDAGYRITNSTIQWHIGTDWGGYPSWDYFTKKTGACVLGYGGDNAITVWEWKASATNGCVLCIGSGCYDWYSIDEIYTGYHVNIEIMTKNAFNYLMK